MKQRDSGQDIEILRSQVERLESNLGQALDRIEELQRRVPNRDSAPEVLSVSALATLLPDDPVNLIPNEHFEECMVTPPLVEVLSAVEAYLTTLNAILPLFHPGRLLQLIKDWYSHPQRRKRTEWAAINVVLALAHSQIPPDGATWSGNAAYYLHNAQSVLSEVIMGEGDILNVQILVGMVMLFQGMQDLKPATMLIAVALRLAHELGLHIRKPQSLDTSQTLEQERVFWIAYLLDRDISLRTGQPPVQREADIDLEWPPADPFDGAGIVVNRDGAFPFNFLRCRVRLARIQGEIHDFNVATRAAKTDNYQRDDAIIRLNHMLNDWIANIPAPFQPSSLLQTGSPNLRRSFAVLYATHLACRTQVYQAHAMASCWMQNLRRFGRAVTQHGPTIPVPLPTSSSRDWENLIDETRGFMRLFRGVERRDNAFIW